MKIENSFIGGCLYAVGYILAAVLIYGICNSIVYLAQFIIFETDILYWINGGYEINFYEFPKIILKIIGLNLILFYVAAFITAK